MNNLLSIISKSLASLLLILIATISFSIISGWVIQNTIQAGQITNKAPGKMHFIDGSWIHMDCRGDNKNPMIFLESGAMGWSSTWSWFFINGVKDYYICSWDRPGLGWSESGIKEINTRVIAKTLNKLLAKNNLNDKPFIMVGHSMGALYALEYQSLFPKEIKALVLLDPAHPQQLIRLPSVASEKIFRELDKVNFVMPMIDFGLARGMLSFNKAMEIYQLPKEVINSVVTISSSKRHLENSMKEYMAWPVSAKITTNLKSSNVPLLVVSSSNREQERYVNEKWWVLHELMAGLSSNGVWVVIPETTHQSIIMNESSSIMVLDQIKQFENNIN